MVFPLRNYTLPTCTFTQLQYIAIFTTRSAFLRHILRRTVHGTKCVFTRFGGAPISCSATMHQLVLSLRCHAHRGAPPPCANNFSGNVKHALVKTGNTAADFVIATLAHKVHQLGCWTEFSGVKENTGINSSHDVLKISPT